LSETQRKGGYLYVPKAKKLRKVEVEWIDITSYPGWNEGELKDLVTVTCFTVGYLLERSDKYVKLAGTLMPSDSGFGDAIVIPRTNIKKVTWLR
jgi:hypothetical protein